MKEIGGYFGVEFSNVKPGGLHTSAVRLNLARNCFAYILRSRPVKHVYVPYYICEVILNALEHAEMPYTFYHVNSRLEPVSIPDVKDDELFLYVNYFGVKQDYISEKLAGKVNGLVIDNAHALFCQPVAGADTFYSLRKFAGVPDGAFLYTNHLLNEPLPVSDTSEHVAYMYKRLNKDAFAGYSLFRECEEWFDTVGIASISPASERFLETYDFEKNKDIRNKNFLCLHLLLGAYNEFQWIDPAAIDGPLYYPLLINDARMRQYLIARKIFIPVYWPYLRIEGSYENYLEHNVVALAIDQRYNFKDMQHIADAVKAFITEYKPTPSQYHID